MKRPRSTFVRATPKLPEHENPLRELLVRLPALAVTRGGAIDFGRSDPALVAEVAVHAQASVESLNLGLAAVGNIWALAAEEIDDGTVPMGAVESLGWLLCTLSDCAASLLVLAAECRQAGYAHCSAPQSTHGTRQTHLRGNQ